MTRADRPICKMHSEYRHERLTAALRGAAIGFALAVIAAVVIGWGLDSWRVANHERLTAEAVAKVDTQLKDCRKDNARYEDIARMEQDVVDAMGARR